MADVRLRPAVENDLKFLTSSWLHSYRQGGYGSRAVPNTLYYLYHHKIIEHLLPRAVTVVACDEEDPDTIFGWICYEPREKAVVIHYMLVKGAFQKLGLGKKLFDLVVHGEKPEVVICTHRTRIADDILRKKEELNWVIYNPYLLYTDLPKDWNLK